MPRLRSIVTVLVLAAALVLQAGCAGTFAPHEGGFNLISVGQEWEMRDDLKREVAKEMRLVRDPEALAFLDRLGQEIVAQTDFAGRPWDFGIVEDDQVNAFNLPGGLVYINSGLIAEADELDELVGVLSHEISHGTARHGTQMMTRQYGLSVIMSLVLGEDPGVAKQLVAGVAGTGILMDYSREAELEADRLGVRYMYAAGYDPAGMASFFEELLEMRQSKPSDVERFFSSHPMSEERIQQVREIAATLPARSGLVEDTRTYQSFRSQFR